MVVITKVNIDYGKIFGPFPAVGHIPPSHFIGLLTADQRTESTNISINPNDSNLGTTWLPYVHPARTQEEQNVEAYVKEGNIYYRMLRIIKAGEELFVWYSTDFAQQLGIQTVKRPPDNGDNSWLTCTNCGEKFKFEFPLMAHRRFRCTKQYSRTSEINNEVTNNNFTNNINSEQINKKVASTHKLVNVGIKRSSESEIIISPRKKALVESREENNNIASTSKLSPGLPDHDHEQRDVCSAFRKVEKTHVNDNEDSLDSPTPYTKNIHQEKDEVYREDIIKRQIYQKSALPYGLQNGFSMLMQNWMVPHSNNGQIYIDPRVRNDRVHTTSSDKVEIINRISNLTGDSMRNFPRGGMFSKQILMEQLRRTQYPYVQPANPMVEKLLSTATPDLIQKPMNELCMAQNWCAKCNATFRMTSDLVYHMRSHHKREFDPMKRKREEKLQCNVCQETFKERHHLTRHMTSHS